MSHEPEFELARSGYIAIRQDQLGDSAANRLSGDLGKGV
jgi:hypothetical protein